MFAFLETTLDCKDFWLPILKAYFYSNLFLTRKTFSTSILQCKFSIKINEITIKITHGRYFTLQRVLKALLLKLLLNYLHFTEKK